MYACESNTWEQMNARMKFILGQYQDPRVGKINVSMGMCILKAMELGHRLASYTATASVNNGNIVLQLKDQLRILNGQDKSILKSSRKTV